MKREKILNVTQSGFQRLKLSTDAVLHLVEALQYNHYECKKSVAIGDLAKMFNLMYAPFCSKKTKGLCICHCRENLHILFCTKIKG